MEFDSVTTKAHNNNFKELLKYVQNQNIATKFGFYDLYLELDSKYRDRSNKNTVNTDLVFKFTGRKDVSTGIKNGVVGLHSPVQNLVQLEVSDILMPNILSNISTHNRIGMVIQELKNNEILTKTSTNLNSSTDVHFIFDIMPIYNLPNVNNTQEITITTDYIRLVPIIRSLIFKAPTTELLDTFTINFIFNDKIVTFLDDAYTCVLNIGPNTKTTLTFPINHNLSSNDSFEIDEIDNNTNYVSYLQNNSSFSTYIPDNNNNFNFTSTQLINNNLTIYDPISPQKYNNLVVTFNVNFPNYDQTSFNINFNNPLVQANFINCLVNFIPTINSYNVILLLSTTTVTITVTLNGLNPFQQTTILNSIETLSNIDEDTISNFKTYLNNTLGINLIQYCNINNMTYKIIPTPITFIPSYLTYKNILNNIFNVDNIVDNNNINFLINNSYYLINDLNNDPKQQSLIQSINVYVKDYNSILLSLNTFISSNTSIISQLYNNNIIITKLNNDLNDYYSELSSLIYQPNINNFNITINNGVVYINNNQLNEINLYRGNKYIFNQSDSSNLNTNNAINILTDSTLYFRQNNNKLIINNIIQDNFNYIQNSTYNIDINDDSMLYSAIVLIPSDSNNVINRLNNLNITVNTINEYYCMCFTYPIELYLNINNTDVDKFNYLNTESYFFRQKNNGNGNNNFIFKIPKVSFNDTIYEYPFDKSNGYNNTANNIKRTGIVDISIYPYIKYLDNLSGINSLIFIINNNQLSLNGNYYSFDGETLYRSNSLRPLPYLPNNPYMALKWSYLYKLDFSNFTNIKYIILQPLLSEGEFNINYCQNTFIYYTDISTLSYTSNISNSILGTYTITYTVSDTNNLISFITRTVIVQNSNTPILTLNDNNIVYLSLNSIYTESSCMINGEPDVDNNISIQYSFIKQGESNPVTPSPLTINTEQLGVYSIIYTYLTSSVTKIVNIVLTLPTPMITLKGNSTYTLILNETTFTDPGYNILGDYTITSITYSFLPLNYVNGDTTYITYDSINNWLIVDLSKYNVLYIDMRELLNKNIIQKSLTTYDKKYLFGRTFKIFYTNTLLPNINNYGVIKLGSLININSYYLNYFIENYSNNFSSYISSINYYNKFEFKPYKYDIQFYYHQPLIPTSVIKLKIFSSIQTNTNGSIFYNVALYKLDYNSNNYKKFNGFLIPGMKFILDLNHYSNLISLTDNVFNMVLSLNQILFNYDPDIFVPPSITSDQMNFISTYNLNNTINNNIIINDIFNSDDSWSINTNTININLYFNNNILRLDDSSISYNLSFGRLYQIKFNELPPNCVIILSLINNSYDISSLPLTPNNIQCIYSIYIDNNGNTINNILQYNTTYNSYIITLRNENSSLLFDLRNELFDINFDQLTFNIFIEGYNNNIFTLNLINYYTIIDFTNVQSELNNMLEYNNNNIYSNIYNPIIKLYYNDSSKNTTINIKNKQFNLKKLNESNNDNYNDFIEKPINMYKIIYNISNISSIKLQKITGNDLNLSNEYSVDIDLYYSFTYIIDFTDLSYDLYENYNSIYKKITNTFNSIVNIYTDEQMNNIYPYDTIINTINYKNASVNSSKYINFNTNNYNDITQFKINVTNSIPNKLYYGINYIDTNNKIVIKGGIINIINIKLLKNINNTTLILYPDSDLSEKISENKMFYLYVDNLYDYDVNNVLYHTNIYQNPIELYIKTPILSNCDFHLKKNNTITDNLYNMTYKQLQENITNLNNTLTDNILGLTDTNILVTSTLVSSTAFTPTLKNNGNIYTLTNVYLISGNIYTFNLKDSSNLNNGRFVIKTNTKDINLNNIIKYNISSNDNTTVLSRNIFYFNVTNYTNTFTLFVDPNIVNLGDYLSYYYEFYPNSVSYLYMNGASNDNLTSLSNNQKNIIQNLINVKNSNLNMYDTYESEKLLSNLNSNFLIIDNYKLNIELEKLQNQYNDFNKEVTKSSYNIIKLKNDMLIDLENLSTYQIIKEDKYNVVYDIFLYKNETYYLYVNNKFNNIDVTTVQLDIYKGNKYIFNYCIDTAYLLNIDTNIITDLTNSTLKLYQKIINQNGISFIEIKNNNEIIYSNTTINNGSIVNTITLTVSFNSYIEELYYGIDTLVLNGINSSFGKIMLDYTINDKTFLNSTEFIIDNNSNTFILEEINNTSTIITTNVVIKNGLYNINTLLTAIEYALTTTSPSNFIYKILPIFNLNDKLKIQIYTNYISYIYNNGNLNTNLLNIGCNYIINYSNNIFDFYIDPNLLHIYESELYFNDYLNSKVYIQITEKTPKILFYRTGQVVIKDYKNIINVICNNNIYELQTGYNYNDNIIVPTYSNNSFTLMLNEYYTFDYSSGYTFNLYTEANCINVYNNTEGVNVIKNDTKNKKLLVLFTTEPTSIYYGGYNGNVFISGNEITFIENINRQGFRIRFDKNNIFGINTGYNLSNILLGETPFYNDLLNFDYYWISSKNIIKLSKKYDTFNEKIIKKVSDLKKKIDLDYNEFTSSIQVKNCLKSNNNLCDLLKNYNFTINNLLSTSQNNIVNYSNKQQNTNINVLNSQIQQSQNNYNNTIALFTNNNNQLISYKKALIELLTNINNDNYSNLYLNNYNNVNTINLNIIEKLNIITNINNDITNLTTVYNNNLNNISNIQSNLNVKINIITDDLQNAFS